VFIGATMFSRFFRKIRRTARNWSADPTRADRNAVIQRIVTAAAQESLDQPPLTPVKRTPTPPPAPSPLASQLLGHSEPEEAIPAELIAERAKAIWIANGKPAGTAAADWARAEAELMAERGRGS
jgi:hypothetical protein